jgi:hypothetical protein
MARPLICPPRPIRPRSVASPDARSAAKSDCAAAVVGGVGQWLRGASRRRGRKRESPIVWRIVPAVSDQALLGRLQEGDEAALAVLYERYAAVLYSLALRVVGDRQLAQEVIQDTSRPRASGSSAGTSCFSVSTPAAPLRFPSSSSRACPTDG